jgi:hypothetical protein
MNAIATNPTSKTTTIAKAHHQWATRPADQRFQSLADLRASVHGRRLRCRSTDVHVDRVKAVVDSDTGKLLINSAIAPCEPNHWALGQFAQQLGAPASYLQKLPANLVADCLNHGIATNGNRDSKFCVAESEDGGPSTLRAVTGTQYGRIWDADVVDAVIRINEATGNRFKNPLAYGHKGTPDGFKTIDTSVTVPSGLYASDRDVFIFLIDGGSYLEAGDRAKLYRGAIIWNSEVGDKTLGVLTFLHNGVCGNNLIYGARDINQLLIRHTRNAPTKFDAEVAPALLDFVNSSTKDDEAVIKRAISYQLPAENGKLDGDALFRLVQPLKFNRTELARATEYARLEEHKCETLWDLIQGTTAYARGFEHIDARVELEKKAGSLLEIVKN